MKQIFLAVLTVATVLSISSPARSDQLINLYNSCYGGDTGDCGRLGRLCGQGDARACEYVNTVGRAGIRQINYHCRELDNHQACSFSRRVSQAGSPGNLARLCSRGNGGACNDLRIIICYAEENFTRGERKCGLLN